MRRLYSILLLTTGLLLGPGCAHTPPHTAVTVPKLAAPPTGQEAQADALAGSGDDLPSGPVRPGNPDALAHYAAGLSYEMNDQHSQALTQFNASVKADPGNEGLVMPLAELLLEQQQTNQAKAVLAETAKRPDASAEFLLWLSQTYWKISCTNEAIEAGRALIKKMPDSIDGYENLLGLLFQGNREDETLHLLNQAAQKVAVSPSACIRLAELYSEYLSLGSPELSSAKNRAVKLLDLAVTMQFDSPDLWHRLARLYMELGELKKADEIYSQLITADPGWEQGYYDLAMIQSDLDETPKALETLDKARAKFPNTFAGEFFAGLVQAHSTNYTDAIRHFGAAESLANFSDPHLLDYRFYFQFGSACERNQQYPQAEKYLKKSIELAPDFAEALNYLGYMWADRGEKLDEARDLIQKAVDLDPKNSAYLDSLGWVLFKLNLPANALPWMEKAVKYSPEPDPTVLDHLAEVYRALHQNGKAKAAWRKSLSLEPNDEIKKKLESISSDNS